MSSSDPSELDRALRRRSILILLCIRYLRPIISQLLHSPRRLVQRVKFISGLLHLIDLLCPHSQVDRAMSSKFSFSHLNRDDFRQYTTSESTYWIRPYFTQHEKRHQLRPCGRSMSCHQISTSHSSQSSPAVVVVLPKDISPAQCYASSSNRITNIALPNGNYIHLPLPQKHRSSSALAPSNRTRVDSPSAPVVSRPTTLFLDGIRKTTGDRTHTHLSSSHLY